jgi:16S rRNA (guanine1516-N2)-methyltransferase
MGEILYTTTALSRKPGQVALARQLAEELRGCYVERGNRSIETLLRELGTDRIVVCGERVVLHLDGQEFFFHPSMALVRIKRLRSGEPDVVVDKSGVRPGDTVLDCTMGLGADAIVFSYVVGETGRVIGVEANPLLAALVRHGLQNESSGIPEVDAAMRRIEVHQGDHLAFLQAMPDRSVDIVYFDPMFRHTVKNSASIAPLRLLAEPSPLRPEAIREAKRVARKAVILKERRKSDEFQRLGFPPPKRRSGSVTYGKIDVTKEVHDGQETPSLDCGRPDSCG